LLLGDAATARFDHSLEFYVIGSLAWALGLAVVIAPLAMRAYRKR
jgi:hypothetical protein